MHVSAQVAVVGVEDEVVSGKVDDLVLHKGCIEVGFPDDAPLHGEGVHGQFHAGVVELALIHPVGSSPVVARHLFLEEQVDRPLLEPVQREVDSAEADVQSDVILVGLLPRQVGCGELIAPVSGVSRGAAPAIRGG